MGGDFGPRFVVPACLKAVQRNPQLSICLVGDPQQLLPLCAEQLSQPGSRLRVQSALECIGMGDAPAQALRSKPDSSMRVALQLVRDGQAQVCVSAGNTGALMALSRHVLRTLPGIDRPAIMTALPAATGQVHLLDLGANVDTRSEHLLQFALMGTAALEVAGAQRPRVALLNVGIESAKGSLLVRDADELLRERCDLNYQGYIEADAVFRGEVDLVVCDGFAGNVLLKGAEGVARLLTESLRQHASASPWRRLLGWFNQRMWRELSADWSPERYNGALLLGVDGLVVKSHGGAGPGALLAALERAAKVPVDVPHKLAQHLALKAEPGCD